jgi:hypothetical protein
VDNVTLTGSANPLQDINLKADVAEMDLNTKVVVATAA